MSARGWRRIRLRYAAEVGPTTPVRDLEPDQDVTFLPLEAIWPDERYDPSRLRPAHELLSGYTRFTEGDVLVPRITPTFEAARSSVARRLRGAVGFGTTELHVLRPGPQVDARFLWYRTLAQDFIADGTSAMVGVAGQKRVRAEFVKDFEFDLPSLDQQRRIADFLDAEVARIDDLCDTRRRHLEVTEERLRAELSIAVDSSSESVIPFKHVLADPLVYGANEPADRADESEPRYIRITDIRGDGTLRDDTYRSLPIDLARPYLLKSGDLLFARSGATVGKTFLHETDEHDFPACHAGYLIRARIDSRRAIPRFVYYWTRTHRYWDEIGLALIQATIPNVSAERYANLPFPAASLDVQRSTVERLDASVGQVNRLRSAARKQLRALRERRDALITAAITGQLDPSSYRASALTT